MKPFIPTIGLSVLICQQIEALLGAILILERRERLHSKDLFISAAAQVRTQVLPTLKKELEDLKVSYIQFTMLDAVIERRNWIIHRLIFDERFNAACEDASTDDLSDALFLFYNFWTGTYSAYERRLRSLGAEGYEPPDAALLADFGEAIRVRTEELRANHSRAGDACELRTSHLPVICPGASGSSTWSCSLTRPSAMAPNAWSLVANRWTVPEGFS